jgi:hypothetical protein
VRELIERAVSFCYGYNMACGQCGGVTPITATDYYLEVGGAHMECADCGSDIHYGPAVIALRDTGDPVPDDQTAVDVAWYHTSTDPRWPDRGRAMPETELALLRRAMSSAEAAAHAREQRENQALHLGTYEAAIESMLRKMRDEDLGGAQFWLYRVALRRRGIAVEPGYRDENKEDASQVTQEALSGWDAIRYLNVRESPGSISLAVRPSSLASVQGIELPVRALQGQVAASLVTEIARIREQIRQIEASRQDAPGALEIARQRLAPRRGVALEREPAPGQRELLGRICQLITDEYLPAVSLPVRDRFWSAMRAWEQAQHPRPGDVPFLERFALMGAMLTRPADLHRALDAGVCRSTDG